MISLQDHYYQYRNLEANYPYVSEAVKVIENVLRIYNFEDDQIFVSFNGGKDATVVLYLTIYALMNVGQQQIKCIYFEEPNPFEEVDTFVLEQEQLIGFKMYSIKGGFKDGLQNFMKEKNLKVVLMGTRKNDPHTDDLEIISTTDHNYPPFLRVNPILYWSYEQVWNFIRSFKVPYCKLYNEGYTYLGNRNTTVKNPYLQKDDNQYIPAWEGKDEIEQFSRKKPIPQQQSEKDKLYLMSGLKDKIVVKQLNKFVEAINFHHEKELKAHFMKIDLSHYKEVIVKQNITDGEALTILRNFEGK